MRKGRIEARKLMVEQKLLILLLAGSCDTGESVKGSHNHEQHGSILVMCTQQFSTEYSHLFRCTNSKYSHAVVLHTHRKLIRNVANPPPLCQHTHRRTHSQTHEDHTSAHTFSHLIQTGSVSVVALLL